MLERHRPRLGNEPPRRIRLLHDGEVHVDRAVRVGLGRPIDHGEQTLSIDVEADRAVGRSTGVRHVREPALDRDVVQLVRIRTGRERKGHRVGWDAPEGIAGGPEPGIRNRVEGNLTNHGVGLPRDRRDVTRLGVIGTVDLAGDRQGQELRHVDRFIVIVVGNGQATRLESHVLDGVDDMVVPRIDHRHAVRSGVGHVDLAPVRGYRHPVRFGAHLQDFMYLHLAAVARDLEDRHGAIQRIRDIRLVAVRRSAPAVPPTCRRRSPSRCRGLRLPATPRSRRAPAVVTMWVPQTRPAWRAA